MEGANSAIHAGQLASFWVGAGAGLEGDLDRWEVGAESHLQGFAFWQAFALTLSGAAH